jgi:hypothetical protein
MPVVTDQNSFKFMEELFLEVQFKLGDQVQEKLKRIQRRW